MSNIWHRIPCCRSKWELKHGKDGLKKESIPNNVIKYTATEKLAEISSGYNGGGIDTRFFDVSIVNHTFENGVGTIEFDGDITIIKNGSSGPPMGAFYNCSNLTSITIPNSVTSIGDYAFYNCNSLTSVTIPNLVTSIGNSAFEGCSGLTEIIVQSGNNLYDSRDNCNAIIETASNTLIVGCKNTVIPNTVTSIGNYAFAYCSGLTSIDIPNSVTSIENGIFSNCINLTSITIPNSVTSIGNYAFYNCSGLTSITSLVTTAPTIQNNTFQDVKTGGTLTVLTGSTGYNVWMGTGNYYLGKYNWTKVEQ